MLKTAHNTRRHAKCLYAHKLPEVTLISLVPIIQLQVLCWTQLLLCCAYPLPLFVFVFTSLFQMLTFPTCPPVSLTVFPLSLNSHTAGTPLHSTLRSNSKCVKGMQWPALGGRDKIDVRSEVFSVDVLDWWDTGRGDEGLWNHVWMIQGIVVFLSGTKHKCVILFFIFYFISGSDVSVRVQVWKSQAIIQSYNRKVISEMIFGLVWWDETIIHRWILSLWMVYFYCLKQEKKIHIVANQGISPCGCCSPFSKWILLWWKCKSAVAYTYSSDLNGFWITTQEKTYRMSHNWPEDLPNGSTLIYFFRCWSNFRNLWSHT